jgi:DNA repair protein RecO (recombination protein O)
MIVQDEGFVLDRKAYGDTGFILSIFSRRHGKRGYFVQGVRKKSKASSAIYQAFNLIDFSYYENKGGINRLKEAQTQAGFHQLYEHIPRVFVLQFLSEFLDKIIHDEDRHQGLFDYIKAEIEHDLASGFDANLHLRILTKCAFFLGVNPKLPKEWKAHRFHIGEGEFVQERGGANLLLTERDSEIFYLLLTNQDPRIFEGKERLTFVNALLAYYELQCEWFRGTKSQEVLGEIL